MLWRLAALAILTSCGETPAALPVCDHAPASACEGDGRVIAYSAPGSWSATTSTCEYPSQTRDCTEGCTAGRCNEDATSWGWISVVELNDSRMDVWGWDNGVRARIAEAEHWLLGLVDNTVSNWSTLIASDGACSLFENPFVERLCDPMCSMTQQCVDGACVELPAALDVGPITVTTDRTSLEMTMDTAGRYRVDTGVPEDLFGPGASVTATAPGGEVTGFTVSALGVAPLEIPSPAVPMSPNTPVVVSWTPADTGSRIQILLVSGPHHPSKPLAAILCDLPDNAGMVAIAAGLVTGFLERTYVWNRFSSITRYRTGSIAPHSDPIELTVGSARALSPSRQ